MRPALARSDVAALSQRLSHLGDPVDGEAWLTLLRVLYEVGRRDLPLGRLFEGHVDALQLVGRYGSAEQRDHAWASARAGALFGMWNADLPGDGLRLEGGRLVGGKAFASGAGLLTHAFVSVDRDGARQLLLLDLDATPPEIDREWWRVSGMQRSETHIVRWQGQDLPGEAFVGEPADYVREPWFTGGALRFAAVQAGGIAALLDGTRAHLRAQERDGDPFQAARLADLYLAAQAAADAVARAGRTWQSDDIAGTLAHVAAARVAVYRAGEEALKLAQAAVGVAAMFVDHPLAATIGDLSTYLRQPGPDAQRLRLGSAVATGLLAPEL